MLTKEN